jgi:hypothetical protein
MKTTSYVAGLRLLFVLSMLLALFQVTTVGQEVSQPRRLRLIDYNGDLRMLVAQLPKSFDVTIGFEMDSRQPQAAARVMLTNPTVDDVIAAIVQNNPNYTWRRHSNTIEILPSNDAASFLDAQVDSFQVSEATADDAVRDLLKLNEVQAVLAQAGLRLAPLIENTKTVSTKISLDLANVSIRQVLNNIASACGSQFWVLQRVGPRNEFFSISFK